LTLALTTVPSDALALVTAKDPLPSPVNEAAAAAGEPSSARRKDAWYADWSAYDPLVEFAVTFDEFDALVVTTMSGHVNMHVSRWDG
jgi:hypothetical protein